MIKEKNYYLKRSLFITATNTDIGKSYAAKEFLKYYSNKGFKVGYFKPIETGVIDYPLDGTMLLKFTKKLNPSFDVSINDVVPYQFSLAAAPYVAKKNIKIDINYIKEKRDYLLQFCDFLIIEGAGGLMVPIEEDYFLCDLIKDLECKTILIAPSKLGGINDTLLSGNLLKQKNIDFETYINLHIDKDSFYEVSYPYYKDCEKDIKFLHELNKM
ncbi:MAG: dethiobiotin synthase [Campylobacterales bacterium]|nr:dethiobiotin synthase [Campylobacterales bacterium]